MTDYGFLPQVTSVRSINRARIISLIRRSPGIMRADLSRLTGLSKGTISALVENLLTEGFLFEDSANGMRERKLGLHLNRETGVAIGFEIWAEECRAIVTDPNMRILHRCVRPLVSHAVQPTIDTIIAMHTELLSGQSVSCLGSVISLPGPVDRSGQSLVFSESLGWSDVPLGTILEKVLGWHVSLINRPRAALLGEHWYGAGTGILDIVEVTISSGIGLGIMVAGQLLGGAAGFGNELGHTTVVPDGPLCQCGNRGCLERVASMPAIIEQVQEHLTAGSPIPAIWCNRSLDPITYRDIIDAARDGDAVVLDVIRQACQYIGVAVANLIDILNPSRVIIGGQLVEVGELVINMIRETAQRRVFPLSFRGVEIVRGQLGPDASCIGACALAIDRYVAEFEPALRGSLHVASGR